MGRAASRPDWASAEGHSESVQQSVNVLLHRPAPSAVLVGQPCERAQTCSEEKVPGRTVLLALLPDGGHGRLCPRLAASGTCGAGAGPASPVPIVLSASTASASA